MSNAEYNLGVINYGSGNFGSLCNALLFLKIPFQVIDEKEKLNNKFTHIILPGVGSYHNAMEKLIEKEILYDLVSLLNVGETNFLGICVGMQILSTLGTEFKDCKGLDLIPGICKKLEAKDKLPVPHMGWNSVGHDGKGLFQEIPKDSTFYFVHSYYVEAENPKNVIAQFEYGGNYTAAVKNDKIYGVQFHPEKSQDNGLQLLKNFVTM